MSDVVYDKSGFTADFVSVGLKLKNEEMRQGLSLAVFYGAKMVGGVVLTELSPKNSVWLNIYTTDRHWCSKRVLQKIFGVGFDVLECRRINALIAVDNKASLSLAERCGFVREGKMRRYGADGQDVYVLGLLREECKFIKQKGENEMSGGFKAIGSALGAGTANIKPYGSETNMLNYLKNYNSQTYDNTLNNLVNNAYNMSQNLNNMGNYTFNVDGSDEARKRAENAAWQAYSDRLQPKFEQQTNDLETRLQNQGITVGSNAYNRAMSNLRQNQNDSYNQAAYQAVLSGQNAFNNSLANAVSAGNFNNNAQAAYISQILSQLQGSHSGYDNAMNIYGIQNGVDRRIDAANQSNSAGQQQAGMQAALTAAQSAKGANDVLLTAKGKVDEFVDNGLQQIAASLENIVTLDGEQNIIGDKTFSGLLQAMTAEKNDISNLVATTAFVNGGNVTDKGSGYIKFASGLILQWGRLVVDNTTASITYKQPFSGTSYAIATGRTSTATATNGVYTLLIRSYSTTGFKCYTVNTAAWWWIAIGF